MSMTDEKLHDVTYRIARTRDDLEQSYKLVFNEYKKRKFVSSSYMSDLRVTLFNAFQSTTTFVALKNDEVIATVSLIPDTLIGLPMDKIFKDKVDALREQKIKIAEVSQLSINTDMFPKGYFAMFNFDKLIFVFRLFKLVLDYAQDYDHIERICIAVVPKHQYLYRFLGFEELAPLRRYGELNTEALAQYVQLGDLEAKTQKRRGLYKIFFSAKTADTCFKNKFQWSRDALRYFFCEKTNIFAKSDIEKIKLLQKSYSVPEITTFFEEILRAK